MHETSLVRGAFGRRRRPNGAPSARLRWLRRILATAGCSLTLPIVALILTAALTPLPVELQELPSVSMRVEDREGGLLREVHANDGKRAALIRFQDLGQTSINAIVAAEDRRFFWHPGVDPLAVGRAFVSDVWNRRIVSGGSTLTMQLARTVRPHRRSFWGKFLEMALALRIEWSLSKDRIIEEYANRVDFGPNMRGLGAASHTYFGKDPRSLSTAEAALLAGLPRGPNLYALSKRPDLAKRRRDRVIARMYAAGLVSEADARQAEMEPLVPQMQQRSFGAPHLVQGLVSGHLRDVQEGLARAWKHGQGGRVRTTLDSSLQRAAEAVTLSTVHELASKHATAAAVVVIDNDSGDILAYVGSPDFFNDIHLGQNDGVRAFRQPGSTLKPFLYALAMRELHFTPATVLPDLELHVPVSHGGEYVPQNYDGHFRGPVRLREALGNSLNIPAVWTLEGMGVQRMLSLLHDLGFASLDQSAEFYGPALALGDGEVTLLELANAYATLARGGLYRPLRAVVALEQPGQRVFNYAPGDARRVLPELPCQLITDILKDHKARVGAFGEFTSLDFSYPVAAKTGTSKGYRDNWAVGYTVERTVAVWVGNFDGSPMEQVSGITGAAPLLHKVMDAAMHHVQGQSLPVDSSSLGDALVRISVCALSGEIATADCPHHVFEWIPRQSAETVGQCSMHERVRVDKRNGLRAGSDCAADSVEERLFESFPAAYALWAERVGRPVAPQSYSPYCPGGDPKEGAGQLEISYPADGARLLLDPDRPRNQQVLEVRVVAPEGTKQVTLRIDGTIAATVGPPFRVRWPIIEGDHALIAESATAGSSQAVHISVR